MNNIPLKYHAKIRKLIKKAREEEGLVILKELLNEFEKAGKIKKQELLDKIESFNPIAVSGDTKPPFRIDWIEKEEVINLIKKEL